VQAQKRYLKRKPDSRSRTARTPHANGDTDRQRRRVTAGSVREGDRGGVAEPSV